MPAFDHPEPQTHPMLRRSLLFLSDSPGARKVLTGTPLTRSMSRRFVPGETVDDVLRAAAEANELGLKVTANYLGEAVRSEEQARAAADTYLEILDRVAEQALDANVSLKFTQMGQDIDEGFLRENLGRVLERAKATDTFIRFDMEGSAYTQRTLDAFEELWEQGWRQIGVVLQAYLKRTAGDVRRMIDLGVRVRICKGAYAEPADIAYQDSDRVRESFIEVIRWLMSDGVYPAIATHDEAVIRASREHADRDGIDPSRFEFQMLYGVRRDLQQELLDAGYNVRVYIPFGEKWYPYLMRRLAERPDNLLFMMGSVVRESPLGGILRRGNGTGAR
jgi:proline dehydrogenase